MHEDYEIIKALSKRADCTIETLSRLINMKTAGLVKSIEKYRHNSNKQLEEVCGNYISELLVLLIIIDCINGTGSLYYLEKLPSSEEPMFNEDIVRVFLGHMTGFTTIVLNPNSYTNNSFLARYIKVEKRTYISQCIQQLIEEIFEIADLVHVDAETGLQRKIYEIKIRGLSF